MMKRKCYGCQTPVGVEGDIDEKLVLCEFCGDIMEGLTWTNEAEFDRLYEEQRAKKAGVCVECSESLGDCVCDQSWSEYLQGEGR